MNRTIPSLLILLAAFGPVALTGCGEPKIVDPVVDGSTVNPKQAFTQGVDQLKAANYAGALTLFEAATTQDAAFTKAWFNAGWAAERTGDYSKAEQYYKKALELKPDYSEALFNLGNVLVLGNKAAEATTVYKGYVGSHPEDLVAKP